MGISAQDATTTTKSRQNVKAKEKTEQTDNTRKQPEFPSQEMIKELNLTDKPVKKMQAVRKEQRETMEKARKERDNNNQSERPDREEMRKEMEKLRTETEAKYKKILSEEQYKKFQEIQEKERKERRDRPQGERRGNGEGRGQIGRAHV